MTMDLKDLIRRLRSGMPNVLKEREAADALERLIAERDALLANNVAAIPLIERLVAAEAERDALRSEVEALRRKPLTEEQVLACVRSIGLPRPMGLTRDVGPYEVTEPTYYLQLLVRAIEKAHGIDAAKEQSNG